MKFYTKSGSVYEIVDSQVRCLKGKDRPELPLNTWKPIHSYCKMMGKLMVYFSDPSVGDGSDNLLTSLILREE